MIIIKAQTKIGEEALMQGLVYHAKECEPFPGARKKQWDF